jgi:hypothetical protein
MKSTDALKHLAPLAFATFVIACDASGAGAAARLIAFDGNYSLSTETSTMDPGCAADGLQGQSRGVLVLESGANPTIRADGLGCSISVTAQGNDAWAGTAGPCVSDGVTGVRAIGITQVLVDQFTLDIPGSSFHMQAHLQRHRASGPVWFCLDIQATVSTTLPPAASAGS